LYLSLLLDPYFYLDLKDENHNKLQLIALHPNLFGQFWANGINSIYIVLTHDLEIRQKALYEALKQPIKDIQNLIHILGERHANKYAQKFDPEAPIKKAGIELFEMNFSKEERDIYDSAMLCIWKLMRDREQKKEITDWIHSATQGSIYDDALINKGIQRTDKQWKTKRNAIKNKFLVAININENEISEHQNKWLLKGAFKAVESISPIAINIIFTLNETIPSTLYHILSAIEGKHMNLSLERCHEHGIKMCLRLHDALYVLEEDSEAALALISDTFHDLTKLNCTAK